MCGSTAELIRKVNHTNHFLATKLTIEKRQQPHSWLQSWQQPNNQTEQRPVHSFDRINVIAKEFFANDNCHSSTAIKYSRQDPSTKYLMRRVTNACLAIFLASFGILPILLFQSGLHHQETTKQQYTCTYLHNFQQQQPAFSSNLLDNQYIIVLSESIQQLGHLYIHHNQSAWTIHQFSIRWATVWQRYYVMVFFHSSLPSIERFCTYIWCISIQVASILNAHRFGSDRWIVATRGHLQLPINQPTLLLGWPTTNEDDLLFLYTSFLVLPSAHYFSSRTLNKIWSHATMDAFRLALYIFFFSAYSRLFPTSVNTTKRSRTNATTSLFPCLFIAPRTSFSITSRR